MRFLLSPAKTLDFAQPYLNNDFTRPRFISQSSELIELLRPLANQEIATLMHISPALAELNKDRFAAWQANFDHVAPHSAKPAVLAFMGDVYEGLQASTLGPAAMSYLRDHLRILSGLYGLLWPFDLIQPYRLEMGTRLANRHGKDLYAFWGNAMTDALNNDLAQNGNRVVINLASEEYFKAIRPKQLNARLIQCSFEDEKGGIYKIISFHAKRARGLMMRFAALNAINEVEHLKAFNENGYQYCAAASDAARWVFRRAEQPPC